MQLFVKKPETVTVDINPSDTTLCLKNKIEARTNIPAAAMRLLFAGKQLDDASTLESASIEGHATLHLVLSLRGGKGGFGAMLRTAGARGVKTTNFDACRDLNGRRLRHVNAEARLREWDAAAEERKLAKQQQDALNAKPTGPPPIARLLITGEPRMMDRRIFLFSRTSLTRPTAARLARRAAQPGR